MYSLDILLFQFQTSPLFHVWFSWFLTCIQVSQEAGKVVWYSHLFKKSPQFVVIHRVKSFSAVNDEDIFLKFPCFLYDPKDLELSSVVPLPFLNQLEHLEVHGSRTVEAWLGEF